MYIGVSLLLCICISCSVFTCVYPLATYIIHTLIHTHTNTYTITPPADCFMCMPVAAVVENKILCMHGGLSPDLVSLSKIFEIKRPCDIPDEGLLCDLLWSDPEAAIPGWGYNARGVSYTFGHDVIAEFLDLNNLELICRAHQVVEDGYVCIYIYICVYMGAHICVYVYI